MRLVVAGLLWVAGHACAAPAMAPALAGATQVQVSSSYGKLPLSFEINRGQTDSQVRFLARGQGYGLFLTPRETVLSLRAAQPGSARSKSDKPDTGKGVTAAKPARAAVVRMRLARANTNPEISGLDPLPGTSNYFIGNDPGKWQTEVTHYARVKYAAVYPGIDLVYHGRQRQLEYDFVVAPGADPKRIELVFEGIRSLSLDKQGNLILATAGGVLLQHKPVVYQEVEGKRTEVEGRYVLRGRSRAGFRVASYDAELPLVIDPVLTYSTFLGGSSGSVGWAITVDASGNAYVTGDTISANFPVTAGAYQSVNLGSSDVFVSKLNASGSALLYSTFLGGSGTDVGSAIALDASGKAHVTGFTDSSNFPTTIGAYQRIYGGGSFDGFVVKLNSTGSALDYSTYLGGNSDDKAYSIALDASGNAHVTGYTGSANFPITAGAFQGGYGGGSYDAFVTKLNTAGSALVYSTFLGGNGSDAGYGIAVDASGNAYVTGATVSANFNTTTGAYQTGYGGAQDAFLTKLNSAGSARVYSTFLGGINADSGIAVALDAGGNAYVAGYTGSGNFPTTVGAYQRVYGGGGDAFVTKVNAAGAALVYSTYLGGSGDDTALGIALDTGGNAYLTGYTSSSNFPATAGAYQASLGGDYDAFVTKFNSAGGSLLYSTYMGSSFDDDGYGIAVDSSGNAYITGYTTSSNFPTTAGAFRTVYGGGLKDAFVAKFSGLGTTPQCTLAASPSTIVLGDSATLTTTCNPAATSYAWTPAAGLVAGPANTATVTPTTTGVFQYSVTGSNASGSGNTASTSVTVICTYSIPASQSVPAIGSTGTLNVTSPSGCAWTASSNVAWITIASGASGSGNGAVGYSVAANTGSSARTGTLTIAGQTFTVTQAGITAPVCTLTASPGTIAAGQSSTLTATCSPAATSYAWTNTGFAATASTGSVSPTVTTTYTVAGINSAGTGASASATVTVTCSYSLFPASRAVTAGASTDSLNVTTTSSCAWSASSNVAWITITSGASGSGNGAVAYSVAANTGSSARTGTLTIAGQTFTVTQAGITVPVCTLTASPGMITSGQSSTLAAKCSPAAISYAWNNTGFAATTSTGTVLPAGTTTYSVTGSNAAGNGNTASATVIVTRAGAETVTYTYDANNQLVGANYGGGNAIVYSYDAAGNPVTVTAMGTGNACAAWISSSLVVHIPILNFSGASYWADLQFIPANSTLSVAGVGAVSDMSYFSSCTASNLTSGFALHIPVLMLNGLSYSLDLQFNGAVFVITGIGQN